MFREGVSRKYSYRPPGARSGRRTADRLDPATGHSALSGSDLRTHVGHGRDSSLN